MIKKPIFLPGNTAPHLFLDGFCYTVGSLLFALSVAVFTQPNDFVPGGMTGIASLLNEVFQGTRIGALILLLNIPLLLLSWWKLGHSFALRTVLCTVLSSLMIDLLELFPLIIPFEAADAGEKILAAVFGGVLMGAGLGLIFSRGATTSGSEIVARLLSLKFPHIPVGRLLLFVDMAVVAASVLVYRRWESALYAVIMIFVTSRLMDSILYGADEGRMLLIMTRREKSLSRAILGQMQRGVTLLKAEGAYSGQDKRVVLCAVRPSEVYRLRRLVREMDPDAFIIEIPTEQVLGEGFKVNEIRIDK